MRPAMLHRSHQDDELINDNDSSGEGLDEGTLEATPDNDSKCTWRNTHEKALPADGTYVVFCDIPSASIMPQDDTTNKQKKFVLYDVCVRYESALAADTRPIIIKRRYNDFLSLFNEMKMQYPELCKLIMFPKKVIIGNFSSDLIAARSSCFEAFLDNILAHNDLRNSTAFIKFLQDKELTKACRLLDERKNELAVPILENCFRLLNKILTDRSKAVLLILCRLVAACTTTPMPHQNAEFWTELAVKRFDNVSDADLLVLYIPLLHSYLQLLELKGRDSALIKERLHSFAMKGMKVKGTVTLAQALHTLEPRGEII